MANCMNCKFRVKTIGSHHSQCKHPALKPIVDGPLGKFGSLMGGDPAFTIAILRAAPVVEINPHGFVNGWANWPLNFDPIWITECLIYEDKDAVN
jgi:hypothetical protein